MAYPLAHPMAFRWSILWKLGAALLLTFVDPRSCANCLLISTTHICLHDRKKKRFNSHSPYFCNFDPKVSTDEQVQSRSDDSGNIMHIVRASNLAWMVDFFKHTLLFFSAKWTDSPNIYIYFKTLILLIKSLHEFFWQNNTIFSSYNFFL